MISPNKKMASIVTRVAAIAVLALTVSATALYVFRVEVMTLAFNRAMAKADIQLENITDLQLGWRSATIRHAVILIGENKARQSVSGLAIEYSLAHSLITNLSIEQANLSIPEFKDTQGTTEPQLLSNLLQQLTTLPINAITVNKLDIRELQADIRLTWRASRESQKLQIALGDHLIEATLRTPLSEISGNNTRHIKARIIYRKEESLNVDIQLQQLSSLYQVTGKLKVDTEIFMPSIAAISNIFSKDNVAFSLPAPLTDTPGTIQLGFSTRIPDSLNSALENLAVNLDLQLNLLEVNYQKLQGKTIKSQLQATLSYKEPSLVLASATGEVLSINSLASTTATIKKIKVFLQTPLQLRYNLNSQAVNLALGKCVVDIPHIQTGDLLATTTLVFSDINISQQQPMNANFNLKAETIKITLPDYWIPNLSIDSTVRLVEDTLSLTSTIITDTNRPLINITASHNLAKQRGKADITTAKLVFDHQENKLSNYFSNWKLPADIQAGAWGIQADLNWQASEQGYQIQGSVSQTIDQLAGFYNDIVFVGLSSSHNIDLVDQANVVTSQPIAVTLDMLNIGIPITDLRSSLYIDTKKNIYKLPLFQAKILGGDISASKFVFHPENKQHILLLNLNHVDIEKVLSLVNQEGIVGTGKINGVFPIKFGPKGVTMDNGKIVSVDPGGVFRYLAEGNKELTLSDDIQKQLVTQILRNYHYHNLSADVQYSHNGTLVLAIKMQGENPDIGDGFPANFNPTIEYNILAPIKVALGAKSAIDRLEYLITHQ
ncbi:MAG: YdbH domain-containing protein [Pseudomonadales bacterium]